MREPMPKILPRSAATKTATRSMTRRALMLAVVTACGAASASACSKSQTDRADGPQGGSAALQTTNPQTAATPSKTDMTAEKITKTKAEWRKELSPEAFNVLFKEGTERSGSSPLNHEKRDGVFVCAACGAPLFEAKSKFESGTGWPSFYAPIPGALETRRDFKLIWPRTEYHCARCGGHQGHVFDDGPEPSGQRFCNNGVALDFVPSE
jgi:peptide-methionine (R)-S-oxide reductase